MSWRQHYRWTFTACKQKKTIARTPLVSWLKDRYHSADRRTTGRSMKGFALPYQFVQESHLKKKTKNINGTVSCLSLSSVMTHCQSWVFQRVFPQHVDIKLKKTRRYWKRRVTRFRLPWENDGEALPLFVLCCVSVSSLSNVNPGVSCRNDNSSSISMTGICDSTGTKCWQISKLVKGKIFFAVICLHMIITAYEMSLYRRTRLGATRFFPRVENG